MECLSALLVTILAILDMVGASGLTPPVLPLIVRNPYLSTWLGHARDKPWENWPMFWTGAPVGLAVMARVDGENGSKGLVYTLLGKGHEGLQNVAYPDYLGAQYDAPTTNLTYYISGAKGENSTVVLSFLSPITPTSTFRQSLPATYINIHVHGSLELSVYIDIDGRWATGDDEPVVEWGFHQDKLSSDEGILPLKTWHFNKLGEQLFTEQNDRAEWGSVLFTGPRDVDHCTGLDTDIRKRFAETGKLKNEAACMKGCEKNAVFAFAKHFELGSDESIIRDSVLFTVAHVQDPVVQFAAARGLTMMRPLWASWFENPLEMVVYHYLDYPNAFSLAANYSAQLVKDADASGPEGYVDILALSARQVMGATTFSGTPEDPLLFLKEISSNGDMQTVDVIFPAFPFFLYTNPRWLAYILEPLIEHQLSGQYPNSYSLHDIGVFPNGTGHKDGRDEYMPVEECGNMLIMALALANSLTSSEDGITGSPWSALGEVDTDVFDGGSLFPLGMTSKPELDSSWVDTKSDEKAKEWLLRSHKLLKQWTGYLVRESLIPATQLSTDDFAGWLANQTNLALKGIIGIRAMANIAKVLDLDEDANKYKGIAEEYIEKWEEYATSRDGAHIKVAYTWYGSWATTYNLFADSLLCFHLSGSDTESRDGKKLDDKQKPLSYASSVSSLTKPFIPDRIYKMQSGWYENVMQRYGLPLDSRHLYTKSDWQFFAASVASSSVRDEIITSVARWVNETHAEGPFIDLYETEEGGFGAGNRFRARPVVGGHFAGVALGRSCGGRARGGLESFLDGKDGQDVRIEGTKSMNKEAKDANKGGKKVEKTEAKTKLSTAEVDDPECHQELNRLETQAFCIYDTNTTKYEHGKYWRQLSHWNRKDVTRFTIRSGRYSRLLAKGEAVGAVGPFQDGKMLLTSDSKRRGGYSEEEARKGRVDGKTEVGKQDKKCRKRVKFLREEALCLFEKPDAAIWWDSDGYWMELGKWERPGIEDLKFFPGKNKTVDTWRTCAEGEIIIQA